jgi:chromosome segregation ATPase
MSTQDELNIKELPNITQAELKVKLSEILPHNWSSAFCNRGINNSTINDIVSDIERRGGYTNVHEFMEKLATELWSLPQKESRKSGNSSAPSKPRNSRVTTTKLPKKEVVKTQLLPTREIAKLVASIDITNEDLQEAIKKQDYDNAKAIQAEFNATQQELTAALAPYVTQEQAIAQTTQEVDELEHKSELVMKHYKAVIKQLAELRQEAINTEREADIVRQNLHNRKEELAKLKAGQYSLSDEYVTLDKETKAIHGTQLVHIPSAMVQTLDNLQRRLENAEAINAPEFVQKDRLAALKALKDNFIKLGMPMPSDLQKELDKIERGYQRWLAAK